MASDEQQMQMEVEDVKTGNVAAATSQPRSAKRRLCMRVLSRICDEGAASAGCVGALDAALDVADAVALLRASGLRLRHVELGTEGGEGERGLHVELRCRRSGLRAVLEAEGACACGDAVGSHDASIWEVSSVMSPHSSQESLHEAPVVGSSLLPEPAPEAAAVARAALTELVRLFREEDGAAAGSSGLRPLAASSSKRLNKTLPQPPLRCRSFDSPLAASLALPTLPASGPKNALLPVEETETRSAEREELQRAAREWKAASQRLASASSAATDAADRLLRALDIPSLSPQDTGEAAAEAHAEAKEARKAARVLTGQRLSLPRLTSLSLSSPSTPGAVKVRSAQRTMLPTSTPPAKPFAAPQRFSGPPRPATPHVNKAGNAGGKAGRGVGSRAGEATAGPAGAVHRKSIRPSQLSPGTSPAPSPARTPARNVSRTPGHTPDRTPASKRFMAL